MNMSYGGGEIIQLSFGPAANAVTSHLCNLQGLASTTTGGGSSEAMMNTYDESNNSNSDAPLCDPYITHAIHKETYVPRVLFVDGRNHFSQWPTTTSATTTASSSSTATSNLVDKYVQKGNWAGDIEVHHRLPYNQSQNNDLLPSSSSSMNSNNHHFIDANIQQNQFLQFNPTQQNALQQFQSLASSLSNTSSNIKSRYNSTKYKHVSSQFVYSNSSLAADESGRCMKWDDDEEEEEEEEEEDEYYKSRRKQAQEQKWNEHETNMQNDLNHAWDTFFSGGGGNTKDGGGDNQQNENTSALNNANTTTPTSTTRVSNDPFHHLQWFNYFMPPHPNFNTYTSQLPFDYIINHSSSSSSYTQHPNKSNQSILYSHYSGRYPTSHTSSNSIVDGITNEYRDELSDKIRKWIEECDALKGIQIMVDNDKSLFAGLASSVLEELNDECKSAGKFSIMVHDGDAFDSSLALNNHNYNGTKIGVIPEESNNVYWRSERKVVDTFRSQLNNGLNLHGIDENSDLVLPLFLTKCWAALGKEGNNTTNTSSSPGSLFESAAVGALAIEATTLPYRLLKGSNSRSKLGIMSGYFQGSGQSDDDTPFPTTDRLSYHEFLSSLRPSNAHTILELSTCVNNNDNLYNRLVQGTSVERRKLEEERERNRNSMYYRRSRGRDIEPGLWLEDNNGANAGVGMMTPLVPIDEKIASRSNHRHFALATSYRTKLSPSMKKQLSTLTSLTMEGMGIRYRPQCSISTVVNQSLSDLTSSRSYAAGSYWNSIFNGDSSNVPVLSVVGNTTRVYSHLNLTSSNMSTSLGRKYQGYLKRDSMAGMVPEEEDCTDALEHCLKLKDTYEPPMMFDDEEGSYFDDNTD